MTKERKRLHIVSYFLGELQSGEWIIMNSESKTFHKKFPSQAAAEAQIAIFLEDEKQRLLQQDGCIGVVEVGETTEVLYDSDVPVRMTDITSKYAFPEDEEIQIH